MWKSKLSRNVLRRKNSDTQYLKNRDKILLQFETNEPSSKQRSARETGNEEVNKMIWEWFEDMSRRKLPISGPMLQEKALQFAKDLGNTEFKASHGWLESFGKRNNIAYVKRGEKAGVGITVK